MTWTKCFAVPGGDSIIDLVHPVTGLSQIYGKTLDEIQFENPDAEIVNFDDWCTDKAGRQNAPGVWMETTEERYHEMLNVLPPASWVRYPQGKSGFLVGEAWDHHAGTGQPRFACFRCEDGKFYEYNRPMTFKEFRGEFGETARFCYVQ